MADGVKVAPFPEDPGVPAASRDGQADPHFTGCHGHHFHVMGEPGRYYNLLSQANLSVNALFERSGDFTIMSEVGVRHEEHVLKVRTALRPEGCPEAWLDGRPVVGLHGYTCSATLRDGSPMVATVACVFRCVLFLADATVQVVSCPHHGDPHPRFGLLDVPHLDVAILPSKYTLTPRDLGEPHGILGQTSRWGPEKRGDPDGLQGEGWIEGTYRDYETSGLFAVDHAFNRYRW